MERIKFFIKIFTSICFLMVCFFVFRFLSSEFEPIRHPLTFEAADVWIQRGYTWLAFVLIGLFLQEILDWKKKDSSEEFTLDFMGVGVAKCGTAWLSACLREHPDIDFARHKETNFFMTPESELSGFITKHVKAKSFTQYKKEFSMQPDKVRGEFSVHYIFDSESLHRIKEKFPNIKIIIALRDPPKFLYSAYWFLKSSNAYYDLPDTFEDALENARGMYLCRKKYGLFYSYVKECLEIFGKKNVHIILNQDIKDNPTKVARELYKFIGVSPRFKPKCLNERINQTRVVKYPILMWLSFKMIRLFMHIKLDRILYDVINTDNPLRRFYKNFLYKPQKYPPMSPATEKKLRTYFRKDVGRLEKLIKRDLSSWKD